MADNPGSSGGKAGYHHGDLRNALVDAATDLARDGGPDAVVLRAAARRVGVSPTAAYRHFKGQGDLLMAVKERGQQRLAERMEADGEAAAGDPELRMRALGAGYVGFAREEPGLFRAAFCHTPLAAGGLEPDGGLPAPHGEDGDAEGGGGADGSQGKAWRFRSFAILVETLDALAASGRMPARRRPGAETSAWSMVHGLATLILDGPLAGLPDDQIAMVTEHALTTIIEGLTAP